MAAAQAEQLWTRGIPVGAPASIDACATSESGEFGEHAKRVEGQRGVESAEQTHDSQVAHVLHGRGVAWKCELGSLVRDVGTRRGEQRRVLRIRASRLRRRIVVRQTMMGQRRTFGGQVANVATRTAL